MAQKTKTWTALRTGMLAGALAGATLAAAAPEPQASPLAAMAEARQYRERLTQRQEAFLTSADRRIAALEQKAAGPGIPAEVVSETRALRPDLEALQRERDDRAFHARAELLDERLSLVESAFGGVPVPAAAPSR